MKAHLLAAVAVTAVATLAFAQVGKENAAPGAQAQGAKESAAPAAPKPAPQMEQLKALEGTWKCEGKQFATDMGPEHAIKYTWSAKFELDGFWLVGHLDGKKTKEDPMPTKGSYQFSYDPATKKFVALWNDNMGGWGSQTSTGWEGDTISLVGDYMVGGQKMVTRDTFTKKSSKELLHKAELIMNGKSTPFLEDTCKK